MAGKPLPSPDTLRQILRYEPDTGKLFWLPRPAAMFPNTRLANTWNSRYSNKLAMYGINANGYQQGAILNVQFLTHRVVWVLQTGRPPVYQVDHINGIRSDNRWQNLREASHAENARNKVAAAGSTSRFNGVGWLKRERKWRARLASNGIEYGLGYFDDEMEAARAYDAKALQLYGQFARLNLPADP